MTLSSTAIAAGVAAGYAAWVTGLRPFSGGATIAVLGAGAAAIGWGRRRPAADAGRERARAGFAVWPSLAAALAGWQLAAWSQGPRSEHPTLSWLADGVLDARPVRAAALVAWLAGASWLARR